MTIELCSQRSIIEFYATDPIVAGEISSAGVMGAPWTFPNLAMKCGAMAAASMQSANRPKGPK